MHYKRKVLKCWVGRLALCLSVIGAAIYSPESYSVSADFSGGFRYEDHMITDVGQVPEGTTSAPYLGSTASSGNVGDAHFQTFHLRLKPRLIVNDQTIIYSQWNLGPTWGKMVGSDTDFQYNNAYATTNDTSTTTQGKGREQYDFVFGREALFSNRDAQAIEFARAWAELITNFGTLRMGRMPRSWGLGLIWDPGDQINQRFQSTADGLELSIKFGNFELTPGWSRVAAGEQVRVVDDIEDLHLSGLYDNPEEDVILGLYWNQRKGGVKKLTLYDIYVQKRWTKFRLSAEFPIVSGTLGKSGTETFGRDYSAFAFATEGSYELSDVWTMKLQLGRAPGEDTASSDANAFWFNPNYKVGNLMFSRNWRSVITHTGQDPAIRPFSKGVVNAKYAALSGEGEYDRWSWTAGFLYAVADETFKPGQVPFDYDLGKQASDNNGNVLKTSDVAQEKDLGFEFFGGFKYHWNENTNFTGDLGVLFPGKYYAYQVTDNNGPTSKRWMWTLGVNIDF